MRTYKEVAENVLRARDEYLRKKARRKSMILKTAAVVLSLIMIVGVGMMIAHFCHIDPNTSGDSDKSVFVQLPAGDYVETTPVAELNESETASASWTTEAAPKEKTKTEIYALGMDMVYYPAEKSFTKYEGCVVLAEFTGDSNTIDTHTELLGDEFDWTNLYYEFKPVEYIYNPYDYDLGERFICVTNFMMEGLFKDMEAGDHLIIFVKDKGPDYPADEYMLNAANIFYTNDGTLFSVLKEDEVYDGMSVEEFKELIEGEYDLPTTEE